MSPAPQNDAQKQRTKLIEQLNQLKKSGVKGQRITNLEEKIKFLDNYIRNAEK